MHKNMRIFGMRAVHCAFSYDEDLHNIVYIQVSVRACYINKNKLLHTCVQ